MNMKEYHNKVKTLLPGGVFYNFSMPWDESPIHFSDSNKSRVFDMEGKEYLDLYARFGAMILGHRNEEYEESLKEAMRVLCVSHSDFDYDALELVNRFVPSAEMIRFGLSGSEIIQLALRIARGYTGKNKFIRFENHYHGGYDNIMGGKTQYPESFGVLEFRGDFKGTAGRARGIINDQSYILPWNDTEALEKIIAEDKDIACIITEPVCVNGGSIMPGDGFLQKLRDICDENGIVLIFDEMITGFRMGLSGAQGTFGVTPDLTTMGKAISGGGVPVSAVVGKEKFMRLLAEKKVAFPGTYNGYPLGTAAVKATLSILGRDGGKVYEGMNEKTERIQKALINAANDNGIKMTVQGPTGCSSFHCSERELKSTGEYTYDVMMKDIIVNASLQNNGILVSSISRIYPNTSLTDADCEFFENRVGKAMKEAREILSELE